LFLFLFLFFCLYLLSEYVMTLILDKSSGVDTDLSRSFTNISQTVGVNLHTVENKISLGSIYECLTIFMSRLLLSSSLFMKCLIFFCLLVCPHWSFMRILGLKFKSNMKLWVWISTQYREQNFFELNLRLSINFYFLASSCPILDHEKSSSSFILFYVLIDIFCELWGWNSNQMWNCGFKSPHS